MAAQETASVVSDKRVTGEAQSQRDLATTVVAPGVARSLSLLFVAVLALVALVQAASGLRTHQPLWSPWTDGTDSAVLKRYVQPRLQLALSTWFGVGNERVVIGRDGWLFFQPGVDFLTGPGMLDAEALAARSKVMADREGIADPQPNPLPALLELQRALAARGTRLVLAMVPDKAMVHADRLGGPAGPPPSNPDWPALVDALRAAGVDVFEVPPPAAGAPAFLAQDTHWTPGYMEATAAALAAHLAPQLPPLPGESYHLERHRESRLGDLVDMLALPAGQTLFRPETVTPARVVDQVGKVWQPQADADVLVLGDSLTNIYSAGAMGWGASSGLAEHLSVALGRPLDVVAQNGGAPAMLRATLARPEGAAHLAGKQVVVFVFTMRELQGQDWRFPPLVIPPVVPRSAVRGLTVDGTILQMSAVPDPAAAPYGTCVLMAKVRVDQVVSGQFDGAAMVVGLLVMQDRALLAASRHKAGDRVRLRLQPFDDAGREIRSLQRSDDLQDYTLPVFWTLGEETP